MPAMDAANPGCLSVRPVIVDRVARRSSLRGGRVDPGRRVNESVRLAVVTGSEFLRKVKRLGRRNRIAVEFLRKPGKGSHGTLFYGSNRTVLKDLKKELPKGLLSAMSRQLGIDLADL